MPEMPEVEGLRVFLEGSIVGRTVTRTELAAFSALKTFATPITALQGMDVDAVRRHGKFLDVEVGGLHLIFHLARAGWLRWYDELPPRPAKPGKGPLALRMGFDGPGFDLTEAGTQRKLAVYVVDDPAEVPGVAALGPDPLGEGFTAATLDEILQSNARTQLKGVLRDQKNLAGIGNAYSDEILQRARLSPFKLAGSLTEDERAALYAAIRADLLEAIDRAAGLPPSELKDGKRSSLRVHGKAGQPCPTCGTTIAEVSFADSFLNYCPGCQTGGKVLADRRMSKLLK
ncbi:Fpg/Nei family DNA glycosylase [Nigerium massiliense]|uniref:Fpg/Nei family DNA glycosylase n=1 Tax=Nigerium massiliense TaxID=1522317 RepID=UPI00059082BD|nr:DNA-formamidopyrimidine glycosylase family protein [Nigerium massiliense]